MTVDCSRQGNVAVVTVTGRMDAESAPQFEKACEELLKDGVTHLAVGVAELHYVSSMGLRSFLVLAKQTKAKDGVVMLCGMKGFVKEVFDMTHVTQLFPLFDSTDAAVQSIRN
jgi:anti-anti-sigma factor